MNPVSNRDLVLRADAADRLDEISRKLGIYGSVAQDERLDARDFLSRLAEALRERQWGREASLP